MAYQKQSVRVLSKGLNLLPPTDKLSDGEAIAFSNWRADQTGRLRSRRGVTSISSRLGGGVPHTLFRSFPNNRYAGVGNLMYRSVGTGAYAALSATLDHTKCGMASYQGFAWIMNRSEQGKDDGTSYTPWLLNPPLIPVGVAAGSQYTAEVCDCDNTETWTYRDPAGATGVATFEGTIKKEGTHSVKISNTDTGQWYVSHTFAAAKDLGVNMTQLDEDEFRMWCYTDNPAAIKGVTITIDCNTGTFDTDYYQAIWSRPPEVEAWSNAAGSTWFQLRAFRKFPELILEAENYNEQYAKFTAIPCFNRFGDTADKHWFTATAIRVQIEFEGAANVYLDQAQFAGGDVGQLDGECYYFQTNENAYGHESNPGPISDAITVSKRAVTVSLVWSVDPLCVKRNIYRIGAGLNTALWIGSVPDRATTPHFIDVGDNDTAQTINKELAVDHDQPPAARGMVGPYFGRLIAFSSATHPARFWWTNVAEPYYWPGSADEVGNWNEAGDASEEIIVITDHKRLAVMYKERGIWRLFGDPADAEPELVDGRLSAVGASAVANAGDIDYFVAEDGIYSFNGDRAEKVSIKVDPLFKGDYCLLYDTVYAVPVDAAYRNKSVLEYANGKLYFSYIEDSQSTTTPTATLVWDIASDTWAHFRLNGPSTDSTGGFGALYYEGQKNPLLGMIYNPGSGAEVVELESGLTDDGAAIFLLWQSAYLDQGLPNTEKRYCDLVIDYYSASTLTVKMAYNNGTEVVIGSLASATRTTATFSLGTDGEGYRAYNAAVRIEGDATTEAVVFSVYLHFYVETREGKTFDTGIIDLGETRAKELDRIEIDYEAAGDITWFLQSDLPGPAIAQRDTGTFAAAATRSVDQVGMTGGAAVVGRRFRLILNSASTFRLHGVRVRVRPIAEYIDGAQGEEWESADIGYGV